MEKSNPITILKEKYEPQELLDLINMTFREIKTFGVFPFFFKVKHLIKPYIFWSSLISLLFIMFGNADYWTFFIPLIPVAIFYILFGIDFLKVQYSLLKLQKRLQKFTTKQVTWDDMVYLSIIVFSVVEDEDENDDTHLNMPY